MSVDDKEKLVVFIAGIFTGLSGVNIAVWLLVALIYSGVIVI